MTHPDIATMATLVVAIIFLGFFSRMVRGVLLIAVVAGVLWDIDSSIDMTQGLDLLTSLGEQIRSQLSGVLDISRAVDLVRETVGDLFS